MAAYSIQCVTRRGTFVSLDVARVRGRWELIPTVTATAEVEADPRSAATLQRIRDRLGRNARSVADGPGCLGRMVALARQLAQSLTDHGLPWSGWGESLYGRPYRAAPPL